MLSHRWAVLVGYSGGDLLRWHRWSAQTILNQQAATTDFTLEMFGTLVRIRLIIYGNRLRTRRWGQATSFVFNSGYGHIEIDEYDNSATAR